MSNVTIGLLGFSQGYYATKYMRHLFRLRGVTLVGCCDFGETDDYVLECSGTTAACFCDELNIPLFHTPQELLDTHPTGVLICNETWKHTEIAIEAMRNGANIFIAKPASFCAGDIEALIVVSKQTERFVLCGQPLRYELGLLEIAKAVTTGAIGEVTNLSLFLNHEAMIHQAWERAPQKSGGPWGTYGVYLFDVPYKLTGLHCSELYAMGGNLVYPQIGAYDTVQAVAKLENNALAGLNLVSTMDWDSPFVRVSIVGTKGMITGEYDNPTYRMTRAGSILCGSLRSTDMGAAEAEHFLDCLNGICSPAFSLGEMLYAARGIEASFHSMQQNSPKKIDLTDCP